MTAGTTHPLGLPWTSLEATWRAIQADGPCVNHVSTHVASFIYFSLLFSALYWLVNQIDWLRQCNAFLGIQQYSKFLDMTQPHWPCFCCGNIYLHLTSQSPASWSSRLKWWERDVDATLVMLNGPCSPGRWMGTSDMESGIFELNLLGNRGPLRAQ